MLFNNSNNGFENEDDFVLKLNNKKFKDVNFNLQLFLLDIFKNIQERSSIKCIKNELRQKYDIFIIIGNEVRRISIKKGIKNSVHTEPVSEFIHFLIENKIPRNIIINILKYHYADGSTNGTGRNRLSVSEYKIDHQEEIDEINKYINTEDLLKKFIDRFIITGRNSTDSIDAILYGVPEDFFWIKTKDIYDILLSKKDEYSSSIHFSRLTYQPLDRCLNYNPRYDSRRFIIQIKWYNLCDDIIETMNNNC